MTLTPLTTSEAQEAREILDRAMKLSPDVRDSIAVELFESIDPPPFEEGEDRDYWRVEIARRLEAIKNGTAKMYSLEDTLRDMERVAAEGDPR